MQMQAVPHMRWEVKATFWNQSNDWKPEIIEWRYFYFIADEGREGGRDDYVFIILNGRCKYDFNLILKLFLFWVNCSITRLFRYFRESSNKTVKYQWSQVWNLIWQSEFFFVLVFVATVVRLFNKCNNPLQVVRQSQRRGLLIGQTNDVIQRRHGMPPRVQASKSNIANWQIFSGTSTLVNILCLIDWNFW